MLIELIRTVYVVCLVYTFYTSIANKRRWWVRPLNQTRKQLGFYEKIFREMKTTDQEHFSKATRMDVKQFNLLLTLLSKGLSKHSAREPIQPENRLAITLMYLAHGCSMQVLAWSFKMGVSTIRKIVLETCTLIWEELHAIYLSFPSVSEWEKIAKKFEEKHNLPNCLGAIDGKHIYITCPSNSGSLYYNYKGRYSIVLIAACDANYSITAVEVGAYGSESDGGIFSSSNFGRQLLNDTLPIPSPICLPGTNQTFPYYFLGDSAFPLKTHLMRPYPGKNLTPDKEHFNFTVSSGRRLIENVFGILVNRWRILGTTLNMSPENAEKVVLATVVLHNFFKFHGDQQYFQTDYVDYKGTNHIHPGRWRDEGLELSPISLRRRNRSSSDAFTLRDTLKNYLKPT